MSDDPEHASGPSGPFSQRVTQGPLSSRSSRLAAQAAPDSEAPPSAGGFDGEDFLYHLYRGSELLQDNCVPQAKEELERALKLQPQDTEGQGLLGVVYFRLGLYPRAIGIYEEIIKACPNEVSPRVNLGLCYLKTGQSHLARDVLEEVIQRVPDHVRAWGYLGLTFERLGELAKAEASEKIDQAIKAGISLAAGAILAIGALGVFLAALVAGGTAILVGQLIFMYNLYKTFQGPVVTGDLVNVPLDSEIPINWQPVSVGTATGKAPVAA